MDVFHCEGTTDRSRDMFISFAMGSAKIGADNLINHAGNPSGPVAVGLSLSNLWKTAYSDTVWYSRELLRFRAGWE